MKYSEAQRELIRALLADCDLPRDALPYTPEFTTLKEKYEKQIGVSVKEADFWHALSSIGKSGGLGTGRKKVAPRTPSIAAAEQLELLRLFPDGIGNRDDLPYTSKFDELHRRFTRLTKKNLSAREFWRVTSRIAKLSRKPKPVFVSAPLGGLDPALVLFLQRQNQWWLGQPAGKVEPYRRWAFSEVVARLNDKKLAKIVVLRGSRRVGKSMIESQLIEDLLLLGHFDSTRKPVAPQRILFVQFDEAPGLGSLSNPIETIIGWYEQNVLKSTLNAAARRGEPAYLFFDEVQNLPNWSAQLKILADHSDAQIVVTGSSALRISEGHDNLAGRMTVIELGPLRLSEIAGIRGLNTLPAFAGAKALEEWKRRDFWLDLIEHGKKHSVTRDKAFGFFSKFGAYPMCHNNAEPNVDTLRQQLILQVITKTIEHDPGHKPHTPALDPGFVRQVLRMGCRYAGQSVLPRRFAQEIESVLEVSVGENRVFKALEFLADSLLISLINPLEMLGKRQSHPPKICICDHFVRDGMLQETLPIEPDALKHCDEAVSTQVGHVVESILGYYLRGIPGVELAWFPERRADPEVDLVVTIGTGRIPIEAKYRRSMTARDFQGVETFCAKPAYAADFGLVITQAEAGLKAASTIAVPLSTFLLLR